MPGPYYLGPSFWGPAYFGAPTPAAPGGPGDAFGGPYFGAGYWGDGYFGVAPAPPPPPPTAAPFEANLVGWLAGVLPGLPAWHDAIPRTKLPLALVFKSVDADSGTNLEGLSGLGRRHVQMTVYSPTPGDCWAQAEALRLALAAAPIRMGSMVVKSAKPHNGLSSGELPGNGSDRRIHSMMREYLFIFEEPRG